MATIINISNKLNNEQKYLSLGEDKKYKVNDSYKTVMKVSELFNNPEVDNSSAMMDAIELFLGKSARKEMEDMSIDSVKVIYIALMAIVQNVSYEDMAARFQAVEQSQV